MAAIAKGTGFLNNVVKSHTTHDHLNLTSSTSVRSVLGKYHEANTEAETVYFSDFIIKINPQGRPQEREPLSRRRAFLQRESKKQLVCGLKDRGPVLGQSLVGVAVLALSQDFHSCLGSPGGFKPP